MLGHRATPGGVRIGIVWGRMASATKTGFYLGFQRGTFINQLRQLRGLTAMPERDPSAASLRARYATEQAESRSRS
jgi:predicted lipid-binding transport protein (Tim44 family)